MVLEPGDGRRSTRGRGIVVLVEEAETSTDQREDDWHPHCSTEIKYRIRRCHDTEEKGLFVPIDLAVEKYVRLKLGLPGREPGVNKKL